MTKARSAENYVRTTKSAPLALLVCLGALACTREIPILPPDVDAGIDDAGPNLIWVRQRFVKPRRAEVGALFGTSVAATDDMLFIGAPGSSDCGLEPDGSMINHLCGSEGTVVAIPPANLEIDFEFFRSPEPATGSDYGGSIAADSNWLMTGSADQIVDGFGSAGAVFVVNRDDGTTQTLTATAPRVRGRFGSKVALSASWAAVLEPGRPCQDEAPCASTALIHIFHLEGLNWIPHQVIFPNAKGAPLPDEVLTRLGNIAINEEHLVVGLPYDDACDQMGLVDCPASGTVRVFALRDGLFQDGVVLVGEQGASEGDRFGAFVLLDGLRIFSGAAGEAAVYEFQNVDEVWRQVAKITSVEATSEFGSSLALNGDRLLIGAPSDRGCATGIAPKDPPNYDCFIDNTGSGAAFVYDKQGEAWVQTLYLKPESQRRLTRFGDSVALMNGMLIVSSPGDANVASGSNAQPGQEGRDPIGAVVVYDQRVDNGQ